MTASRGPRIVDTLVSRLADRGVKHIFGVPGGDCNLDIIDAAAQVGIEFVLTRSEVPALIMAAVSAELTGTIGVAMTTRGPGLANGINGVAYAYLDRAPVLIIADGYDSGLDYVSHQRFDQAAMLAPLVKDHADLSSPEPVGELDRLLDSAFAQPPGPVYLEVHGNRIRQSVPEIAAGPAPSPGWGSDQGAAWSQALDLVSRSRHPTVIVGLQALTPPAVAALRRLVEQWSCPVFTTYKAKGSVPDDDPCALGHFIGGVAEEPTISRADLIILYGFDAVECPPQLWRYHSRVIELTEHAFDRHLVGQRVSIIGDIASALSTLTDASGPSWWEREELQTLKKEIRSCAAVSDGSPISPQQVVEAAARVFPSDARITVDAGAHMLPAMHLWVSHEPRQALISRGLATMGFALPAAVASALVDPGRLVVAFTGDGGLMMNPAELATAAQNHCRLVVVVFNDSALTLIGAKQRRRDFPSAGVNFSSTDFAAVARGFGCHGVRVERPENLEAAFARALTMDGPCLIDVVVDPTPYDAEIIAIRG